MARWGKILRRSAVALAGLLALVALVFAGLQTEFGRSALERKLEDLVSTPDARIDMTDLQGRIPDRLTIARITIADKDGPWATIEQLSLDWRPLRLLSGRLHIDRLSAERVLLARQPVSTQAAPRDDAGFTLPRLPFDLSADQLAVDAIEIAAPVLGQSAVLRFSGSLSAETDAAIETTLSLERLDGPQGSISLQSSFDLADRILTVDARMREAPDGLTALLIGAEGLPEIDIALTGRGPLGDWRGQLTGGSGANRIAADLAVAAGDVVMFRVNGNASFADLAPPDFRPLLGSAASFSIDGRWRSKAGVGAIDAAEIGFAGGDLALSGEIDTNTGAVSASLRANADGRALAPLIGPASLTAAALEADIAGPVDGPDIRFSATLRDLSMEPVSAASVGVIGAVTPRRSSPSGERVLNIAATVETAGFTAAVPAIAAALGARPNGFIAGDLDLARNSMDIEDVRLSGAAATASASGRLALDGATGELMLSARLADLASLSAGLPVSPAGAATLASEVRIAADGLTARVHGNARDFASGIDALDSLLGERFELAARIAGAPDAPWQISDVAIDAANASLGGSATFPPDFAAIDARFTLRVPDLAPLGSAVGIALAGRAESDGAISGRFDDLTLSARLAGDDLTLDTVAISRATATVDARNLDAAPNGSIALEVSDPVAAKARSDFRLDPEALRLTGINAESPGLEAGGELVVPTDGRAIAGTIRAIAADLRPVTSAFGQPVSGRASARVEFGEAEGEARLRTELNGSDLAVALNGEPVRIATLEAGASIAYAREDIGLAVTLDAARVTATQGTLETMRASLEGSLSDFRFSASARGDVAGATDLAVSGAISRAVDQTNVDLASLSGALAGREIALQAPAQLRFGDSGLAVDRLQLAFAGGALTAQGEFSETAVSGGATLRAVPIAALTAGVLAVPVDGAIDGELRLGGTPAQPRATLAVDGRGLQLRPLQQGESVPVDLALSASLDNGVVTFDWRGDGGAAFSLTARGRLPVRVSGAPVEFSADHDRAIEATVELLGDIAVVEHVVPIDPHRLRGTLRARATVAGTLARPVVAGEATLSDGAYENIEIGTVLDDVVATVTLADERASVRATAKDSASGQLALTGNVELGEPRSVDLALRMTDMTLVQRDEVTAALSGDLFASGPFGDLLVSGQVETRGVEVRLIDALPAEVVQLEVTEVGQTVPAAAPAPPARDEPFAARLEIDVVIPNRLFVRGRGLDSEWMGELRVFGTTQDAEVTGRVSAVRGQYSFAGKTFDLSRGVIVVDERDGEFVAILDIETTFTDEDFVAKIKVAGPSSEPTFELSSTPQLPRDEILSRILFGRGTGQLSPLEALQLAQAAASLTGVGGGTDGVLDKVRSALGVDVLQVSGGEGDEGPTVRAGKYVADNVFVGAKQGAGPGTSAATVEIKLTPRVSVESEVGQTGRSEVGVSWHYDY